MKKYKTCSDAGCVLFGTEEVGFRVPNRFGDCTNTVIVFDSDKEFCDFVRDNDKYAEDPFWKYHFQNSIEGKFNLYKYDCSDRAPKDIKCKLEGRYQIYVRCEEYEYPTIAVVKQER